MAITPVSAITDYQSLQNAMADLLDRSDMETQIPMFIQLCEVGINRLLRHRLMLCKGQSVGWRVGAFVPLPDDWLEARNVDIVYGVPSDNDPSVLVDGPKFQATYQPPGSLDQMRQRNPQFRPNDNFYYSYYEGVIEIYPAVGKQFRLDLEYYAKIPSLTDDNPTNWLLEQHPDLYLYGSLVHTAPFLRDDGRLAMWNNFYAEILGQLEAQSKKALTSGSRLTKKVATSFG